MKRARVWTRRLLNSRYGLVWMGLLSAMETTILPIPIELVMVPYMLERPRQLWWIATVTLIGCIAGALIGYAVGYFVFDSLGTWLLEWFNAQNAYASFKQTFNDNGFLAILTIGVTPVPFQIALLAAGMSGYALPLFLVAVTLARGIRYFGLALLVWLAGDRAISLWQRHRLTASALALLLIGAVFVGMRVLGS